MATNRPLRAAIYLVMFSAVLMPASIAIMPGVGPLLCGGFVVLVATWGAKEPLSTYEGAGLGFAVGICAPVLYVLLNVGEFLFIYLWTATNAATSVAGRDALAFMRSEFSKAFAERLAPYLSPGSMLSAFETLAIPGAIGGALAGAVTRSRHTRAVRRALDYVLLWKSERRSDDFDEAAKRHPQLIDRAAELRRRGFDEEEARRIALEEFRDPFITQGTPTV